MVFGQFPMVFLAKKVVIFWPNHHKKNLEQENIFSCFKFFSLVKKSQLFLPKLNQNTIGNWPKLIKKAAVGNCRNTVGTVSEAVGPVWICPILVSFGLPTFTESNRDTWQDWQIHGLFQDWQNQTAITWQDWQIDRIKSRHVTEMNRERTDLNRLMSDLRTF